MWLINLELHKKSYKNHEKIKKSIGVDVSEQTAANKIIDEPETSETKSKVELKKASPIKDTTQKAEQKKPELKKEKK